MYIVEHAVKIHEFGVQRKAAGSKNVQIFSHRADEKHQNCFFFNLWKPVDYTSTLCK